MLTLTKLQRKISQVHPEEEINPFKHEIVDTSIRETTISAIKLIGRAGLHTLNEKFGIPIPSSYGTSEYHPIRYVELEPDFSELYTTTMNTDHRADVYNYEALESDKSPLVMTMELAIPHNRGFKAPVIENLGKICAEQERALIVIGSEGFEGQVLPSSTVRKISFENIALNTHEVVDMVSESRRVEIPSIFATGASRGGTNSLILATKEISEIRHVRNQPERNVSGVISFAPAGLEKAGINALDQFLRQEPSHMTRKASKMSTEELRQYGQSLTDTVPPKQALKSILKTALLFATQTPLTNISNRIDSGTDVDVVVMDKDGITFPDSWLQEMGFPQPTNRRVHIFPGHHLSIDSLRKIPGIVDWHLSGRDLQVITDLELVA